MERVHKSIQNFESNINDNITHLQPYSLIVLACGDEEGAYRDDQIS